MKTDELLSVENALERGLKLPFALVRTLSSVTLGKTPERVELGELIEARFFSEREEIRIFRQGDGLRAAPLEETGASALRKTYRLANPRFGGSITVCQMLKDDEDGQTYVSETRLADWKGVSDNG